MFRIKEINFNPINLQLVIQQDCFAVGNYLNEVFPEGWIERRSPIEWSFRSPDINLLDFFRGTLKLMGFAY